MEQERDLNISDLNIISKQNNAKFHNSFKGSKRVLNDSNYKNESGQLVNICYILKNKNRTTSATEVMLKQPMDLNITNKKNYASVVRRI